MWELLEGAESNCYSLCCGTRGASWTSDSQGMLSLYQTPATLEEDRPRKYPHSANADNYYTVTEPSFTQNDWRLWVQRLPLVEPEVVLVERL